MEKLFNKLPAGVIFYGGIVLIVLSIVVLTYFTIYIEGVASIGFLALAILFLWKKGENYSLPDLRPILPVLGFVFLGIIFDGAGNFIYNKPIQLLFCPAETTLVRDVKTYENHEGDDVAYHKFSCRSPSESKTIKEISIFLTVLVRFVEYILIGSLLFGIYWLILRLKIIKQ